jgi:DNA-directed RNA polymerase specialized sigma54-like protein
MNDQSKGNEDQSREKIDDIIDDAIENAEARRELSDDDLDEVNGGSIIDKIIIFGGYLFG